LFAHDQARARVRGYLANPDRGLAALACDACDKLRDDEAVPALVRLLGGERGLARCAHAALASLTGLGFRDSAETWADWLDENEGWWAERAEPCRAALGSGTPAEAAAALEEVAAQRLYVARGIELLQLALERPEPDLQRSACRALTALPLPSASL